MVKCIMSTTLKTGNPLKRFSLEGEYARGLVRKTRIAKAKAHGADVGMCPRKVAMHCFLSKDHEIEEGGASVLYMAIGSAIHNAVQESFRSRGLLLSKEYRVESTHVGPPKFSPLAGYIDLIVKDEDNEPAIIEIKTCGNLPPKPKPWHTEQAIVYSLLSGVKRAYLFYVSRNVADYTGRLIHKMFPIPFVPEHHGEIARRMALSALALRNGFIPPIPPWLESKNDCGFCPFVGDCWEDAPVPTNGVKRPSEGAMSPLLDEAARLGDLFLSEMDPRLAKTLKDIAPVSPS